MKENINETVLSVLRKNKNTNQIEIDYVNFENPLSNEILAFEQTCDNPKSTLKDIIEFIKKTTAFNLLTTSYRYCSYLDSSYQAFSANNQDTITEINNRNQLILFNVKENPEKYDAKKEIEHFKQELKKKYNLWVKAYSINKTYRICHEDKSIIAFSHRIDGWSKPLYQLTPNFSLEIKTNFGYGRASYFYTKLKYKDIEITPFSEWINYEFAEFSEIVRYTQSHLLENEYWLEAMVFSKDACNMSTTDEVKFVEKYIIEECEEMVKGLEEIFHKEHFSFKHREKNNYTKDKKGHVLVEFRGEKISGALDFISKILEFKKITSIQTFINRIEVINKKIQPILKEEAKIIKIKLSNLKVEKDELKPKYDFVIEENNLYNKKKTDIQKSMIANGELDLRQIDTVRLNKEFIAKYPEYEDFTKEYKSITKSYKTLIEQINNLTKVYDNITSYKEKIIQHFKK
ncbi:hypothetical protein [Winogradskyella sp. PC D3.3]